MSTASLTSRQEEILNLIKANIRATGYPPTRAEIAKELGFRSPNAAEEHLRALAKKGVIEMIKGTSRGIRLIDGEQNGLPLVGRVAAGEAILALENIEDYLEVAPDMFYPKADFFLKVQGTSMKNIGIMDGDLLAVHKTNIAENGEIVVARIEEEVTVKRIKTSTSSHKVELIPENEDFSSIHVDLSTQNFAIEGISVGVLRTKI
ncbi:MAG: LexA repressor [Porticoccus sp.]|jgi:repressor LexA|nr:LexA repressor [Porticoccus sp.]|tara:strand:- start:8 stop:622 length:615 start_codon:yes stop_codon:yes gene_type:complete